MPIEDVKIAFYTTNPEHNVLVKDNITVNGNIASVLITPELFNTLEDGLLIYTVYATKDGVPFMGERQSNYYLKSGIFDGGGDIPTPSECKLQEKYIPVLTDYLTDNKVIIEPDEGYDGMSKATVYFNSDYYFKVLGLYQTLGTAIERSSEDLCTEITYEYMLERKSLSGVFDNFDPAADRIIGSANVDYYDTTLYEKCFFYTSTGMQCEDISNMYTGSDTVPAMTFKMLAGNVKKCQNAFNGFNILSYLVLTDLGKAFETEQTLDISATKLNDTDGVLKSLAESLYNFNEAPNNNGVVTSYIKGVTQPYRHYFTERGWVCID